MRRKFLNVIATAGAVASMWACASRPFDRLLAERRWTDAVELFGVDSTLVNDERALYSTAVLLGSPTKTTYDPERARSLFQRMVATFPNSKYVSDAEDRIVLLDEALRARASTTRVRDLEARIAELTAQQARLRAELDSAAQAQSDALKRSTARLEADVRDRDEQLRALRLELKQLKEIDLKPRSAGQRPPTGH